MGLQERIEARAQRRRNRQRRALDRIRSKRLKLRKILKARDLPQQGEQAVQDAIEFLEACIREKEQKIADGKICGKCHAGSIRTMQRKIDMLNKHGNSRGPKGSLDVH